MGEFFLGAGRGILGILVLLGIAWACSCARREVSWRTVVTGLGLQLVLALLILRAPWFEGLVEIFAGLVVEVLGFAGVGAEFVFGPLADAGTTGFVFAFQVLPTIIFFSALTAVLYYLGVLQKVVLVFAWVMTRTMRLSGAESLAAAANVFVGQTEAPLLVRPFIPKMTRSEMMALMTGGFATIAGSVLGAYIGFLGGGDEEAQRHYAKLLLCASMMNAPAALVMAKLLVPETGRPDPGLALAADRGGESFLDALAQGTTTGLKLALNVAAMLLVFLAFIALVDWVLLGFVGGFGPGRGGVFVGEDGWLNRAVAAATDGRYEGLTLGAILGVLGAPFAWLVGVPSADILPVGQLLGTKLVANEFVAYTDLKALKDAGALDPKSVFLATFALCGFANFGSIGIQLGGIGGLAPERRADIAGLAFRALLGGTLASLLTASVAGMFFTG